MSLWHEEDQKHPTKSFMEHQEKMMKAAMDAKQAIMDQLKPQPDMVNHPPHYKSGGVETIDVLKAKLSPEQYRGFLVGNVLKYLTRADHKGQTSKDYEKAQWYLNRLVEDFS